MSWKAGIKPVKCQKRGTDTISYTDTVHFEAQTGFQT